MKGQVLNKNEMVDSKPLRLRWYDPQLDLFFPAGIGFYNQGYGDYTIKLNMGRGKLYLRPVTFEDNQTQFRVEEMRQENGKVIKGDVGNAFMDESTNGTIHIKIGGYSDILILG